MADIVSNPKALRDYVVLDRYEAGIALRGSEVKALRAGKAQIRDAFVRIEHGEAWLYNAQIEEYAWSTVFRHKPDGTRKLLLHKSEIRKMGEFASVKGNALFPLSFYWKDGKVKVVVGAGKGKAQYDKRQVIHDREADREVKRAIMHRLKSKV